MYPKVDTLLAGFSPYWLSEILRKSLSFTGAIISDDLMMKAAVNCGTIQQRYYLSRKAGCDLSLVCHDKQAVISLLDSAQTRDPHSSDPHLIPLYRHDRHYLH